MTMMNHRNDDLPGEEASSLLASSSRAAAAGIVQRLRANGYEAFFVGGCVRDILRGVAPGDYDIVTSAPPEQVQKLFSHTVPVGARFGVVLVVEAGRHYEVATCRADEEYIDGRRPSRVRFVSAEEDVKRRDFTVNGLLMDPVSGEMMDYVGGRADLERHLIRTIGNPEERFSEDRLRMLRAVRFAAALDFTMDPDTFAAIGRHAKAILQVSAERIRDELTKIITGRGARQGLTLLKDSGLLEKILPEVADLQGVEQPERFHPEGDVWEHTLLMLDRLPFPAGVRADLRLAWAALLHDIGKARTRSADASGVHFYGHVRKGEEMAGAILRRLKFSNADMMTIMDMIRKHMNFMHVRDMRPGRLKRFLRSPDFDLHLELHRLDCLGSHGMLDNYHFCRDKLAALSEEELHPPRLMTGHDLMAMGFVPSPSFREILHALEEAQLNGEISTAAEARRLVLARFSNTKK